MQFAVLTAVLRSSLDSQSETSVTLHSIDAVMLRPDLISALRCMGDPACGAETIPGLSAAAAPPVGHFSEPNRILQRRSAAVLGCEEAFNFTGIGSQAPLSG